MRGRRANEDTFDRELAGLSPERRWREWMGRVEAVLFAAAEPVPREVLSRVVGRDCDVELVIDDIRTELAGRPYDIVAVAGGWQMRTRRAYGAAVRAARGQGERGEQLSSSEMLALVAIAYFQPITRSELSAFFGREVSRDLVARLRAAGLVAAGPRSPQPGAPYTYVTTPAFLARFGFTSLRELPDIEQLEEAGLLDKDKLLAGGWGPPAGEGDDEAGDDPDSGEEELDEL